ncbi:hypothetical protein [Microbaculum marinum]|uniref:Uncharacterized protein n=1 Tax=Microbaculum marinum TaxID=1764581 RepID=A0AAW9RZY9_9HYPH
MSKKMFTLIASAIAISGAFTGVAIAETYASTCGYRTYAGSTSYACWCKAGDSINTSGTTCTTAALAGEISKVPAKEFLELPAPTTPGVITSKKAVVPGQAKQ